MINRAPRAWGRFYEWLDRQENYGSQMGWLFLAKARLSQLLLRFQPTRGGVGFSGLSAHDRDDPGGRAGRLSAG